MSDLEEGAAALLSENADAGHDAARSTMSMSVLNQRLVIIERFLIALARQSNTPKDKPTHKYKSKITEANLMAQRK